MVAVSGLSPEQKCYANFPYQPQIFDSPGQARRDLGFRRNHLSLGQSTSESKPTGTAYHLRTMLCEKSYLDTVTAYAFG